MRSSEPRSSYTRAIMLGDAHYHILLSHDVPNHHDREEYDKGSKQESQNIGEQIRAYNISKSHRVAQY